jgi:1-phosphatidylinositol-4-phosphate 5-kinase
MNSVYYTDHPLQTFYDLKGSALGRDAKPGQTVKKDNDLRRGMPESALALPTKTRQVVRSQVEKDCEFLREMGIMDYSMLVGVHNIPADRDESIGSAGIRGMRGSVSRVRANTTEASLNAAMAAASFGPSDPASNLTEQPTSTSVRNVHQAEHVTGLLFDDDLDDDDSSYLFGSPKRPNLKHPSFNAETERKKQATIDKLYWPFHRLYDIHGYRRLQPAVCYECLKDPCTCGVHAILKGYNIPEFVPPLSERKDGGLEMDTVGLELPIKMKSPQGEQFYDGKIFYMGIIDVLQEYTSRKALESKYRKVSAHGKLDASCVSPHDYGGRFLCFFDEYSQRSPEPEAGIEMGIEEFEARTCDEKTKKL